MKREDRKRSRMELSSILGVSSNSYAYGHALTLPFGLIFPTNENQGTYFDFQIEGVGTKTLIAEIMGKYDTIGIDAVAMVVNDIIRSGASPLLLSDALHISRTDKRKVRSIIKGVMDGAKMADCVLASGETGDVGDILHRQLKHGTIPFDLFVAALGITEGDRVIRGVIEEGDAVIGLESSGIHSNGLSLARRVLLNRWGGLYNPDDSPYELGANRSVGEELLRPTRIYVKTLKAAKEVCEIKAAIHITGDGFSKFRRLLEFQANSRIGFKFDSLGTPPAIFRLIEATARRTGRKVSREEMFRTFNMGYGFALIVSKKDEDLVLDSLNRQCPSRTIGRVVDSSNSKIALKGAGEEGKTISL